MPHSKAKRSMWILLAGFIFCAFTGGWYIMEALPWHESFHRRSASSLFQEVTGKPVPAGVTNLKAAARAYVIKAWVWMRFRATDATIEKLIDECATGPAFNENTTLEGTGWAANSKYNDLDKTTVGWSDVAAIENPEIYGISRGRSPKTSYLWLGEMIVDRKNHMIYIHAGGD